MLAEKPDGFEIVMKSISGQRPVDEQTFASVAVLAERLDRVKRNNKISADVCFSPQVEELALCEMISAIS